MKISISAGKSKVEREVAVPDHMKADAQPQYPFELRRKIVAEKVVQNRRRRMRAIDGGKA